MAWPPIPQTLVSSPFPVNFGYTYLQVSNTQSTATPTNFQQYIQLPPQVSLNTFPLRFYADPALTQPLYAWYETPTTVWVLLPNGIPANSSINIYFNVDEPDGIYTGMAPYLSSTYGALDNGFTVFPALYDNFAGTTLKSIWNPIGLGMALGSYSVNNGFTSTCNTSERVALDTATQTYSLAGVYFESCFGPVPAGLSDYDLFQFPQGVATPGSNTDTLMFSLLGNVTLHYTDSAGDNLSDGTANVYLTNPHNVLGVSANGSVVAGYVDYQVIASVSETYVPSNIYFNAILNNHSGTTSPTLYWTRIRAYPPNGIQPSVSFV